MSIRHLLGVRRLDTIQIQELIEVSAEFRRRMKAGESMPQLPGKVAGLLFFEGSTRTRVSFERAAFALGIQVTNFTGQGSSMAKGETLRDTILTLRQELLDTIVVRHPSCGSPQLVADFFRRPVINAGDGEHEHPTQALGDALTILLRKGRIQGLTVAIVGDVMHSRVARSNAWLLSKLGAKVRFVGPNTLLPSNCALLPGEPYFKLSEGLEGADVVMCLRLQKERMAQGLLSSIGEYRRLYQVNERTLRPAAKDVIVMHPGPINRGVELDDATADGPRSVILDQVESAVYTRAAVLFWALGGDPDAVLDGATSVFEEAEA